MERKTEADNNNENMVWTPKYRKTESDVEQKYEGETNK